jgi:hypothetical protein
MYLRYTVRKKDGKVHRYWRLVRSVRVGRRVIQQTVAHLGELDEHGRLEARGLARQPIGTPEQRFCASWAKAREMMEKTRRRIDTQGADTWRRIIVAIGALGTPPTDARH